MLQQVACAVQPPHLASPRIISQRMQHCQHRSNAYASAQENHRTLTGLGGEEEASARRGHIPHVSELRPGMQYVLATPFGSSLTPIRYVPAVGGPDNE